MGHMYSTTLVKNLNTAIEAKFPHLYKVEAGYSQHFEGVSRMVMLDRYAQKDKLLETLTVGDLVIVVLEKDPWFPVRGLGYVVSFDNQTVTVEVLEEYKNSIKDESEFDTATVVRKRAEVEKPLEIYYEQIARRVSHAIAQSEKSADLVKIYTDKFDYQLRTLNLVPAGRVLYGAGSGSNVTYFNCFVMPFIRDSRQGISEHRKEVMEIMSRGGGVGTNGSTLRPKNAIAKDVGGKSSGAVSWLNDLSNLTHLVEQGGSRRGAQMIMMADWHPDIFEFIISKMQNPKILLWLSQNSENEDIKRYASEKLKFVPISQQDSSLYEQIIDNKDNLPEDLVEKAYTRLNEAGHYEVANIDFLTGANISVTLTDDFMESVEADGMYDLRFPDLDALNPEQKVFYDEKWHEIGDVREWAELGLPVKVYQTIRARHLWDLICFCATYSAEPGIFFIDNANKMTNAKAYGQKVVATNPCGEQPLAPYSVCNLAALNLANFVNKATGELLEEELCESVRVAVRMQDNIIDQTPYFLEANEAQATGERRIGLGVMGLHDLLIWAGLRYGSSEANEMVDRIFNLMAITAYETSIDLAKEKGSFPLLSSRDAFVETGYMKLMPDNIKDDVKKYGIRNSHLLTIAPTGSTGTMVGVSTGLEPYFSFKFYRSGRLGKFMEVNASIVNEYLKYHPEVDPTSLPDIFVSAMELSPEQHADTQCVIQRWIDSSISKTVNAPKGFSVRQVQAIYERLYKGGAKGGTVYVDGSRDSQVLTLTNEQSATSVQLPLSDDLPITHTKPMTEVRADRQDRNIGVEIGDICPICLEGTVEEIGGCNTCTNCNAQLKCGL